MNENMEFELDEAATRSYNPPGWPVQNIEIKPSGKAPQKYGPTTYRFAASLTLSAILPRRGWTLVKTTKNYAYLTPPPEQPTPPFTISIAIPMAEECLALARRSYARGESWIGQLGEWPAWYLHERNTDIEEMWCDTTTGQLSSQLHKNPPQSSLTIGEWGVWKAKVTGVEGEFMLGVLPPSHAQIQSTRKTEQASKLEEGASRELSLTRYERNDEARRRCIEYYGAKCRACGLVYEAKYGLMGVDLIHVHHLTPISAIGETYEVDPIKDLIPLCATCHHVIHRRNPPYSVDELQDAIASQSALMQEHQG
ncbi:HNH endonuclease [Aeromonas caviae]